MTETAMEPEAIEFLSAILIYSRNAERLAKFYRDVLGLPLEEEKHGSSPVHFGCELGDVHFAIHPGDNDLPEIALEQRYRLAFTVFSTNELLERLKRHGLSPLYPPKDASFAVFTALHDPDGNYVEFTELRDGWFEHLQSRKTEGKDIVVRWQKGRKV
jgi:catechol 2,3-dioxygenase-like lactoylglutathione lyase family enzyme